MAMLLLDLPTKGFVPDVVCPCGNMFSVSISCWKYSNRHSHFAVCVLYSASQMSSHVVCFRLGQEYFSLPPSVFLVWFSGFHVSFSSLVSYLAHCILVVCWLAAIGVVSVVRMCFLLVTCSSSLGWVGCCCRRHHFFQFSLEAFRLRVLVFLPLFFFSDSGIFHFALRCLVFPDWRCVFPVLFPRPSFSLYLSSVSVSCMECPCCSSVELCAMSASRFLLRSYLLVLEFLDMLHLVCLVSFLPRMQTPGFSRFCVFIAPYLLLALFPGSFLFFSWRVCGFFVQCFLGSWYLAASGVSCGARAFFSYRSTSIISPSNCSSVSGSWEACFRRFVSVARWSAACSYWILLFHRPLLL